MKKYIGVDLHKKSIVVCVVDKEGKVLERRTFACCEPGLIAEWFAAQGAFEVVVEATASYEWFVQLIESHAERVLLAHPAKLRIIAASTRKSDKVDSTVLAQFLAWDMIPTAYRPTPRQQEHRRLVRYRHDVQSEITSIKSRIRRLLSNYNADCANLFSKAGRAVANALKLSDADRFVLEEFWLTFEHLDQRLATAEKQLREFAKSDPPADKKARALLQTIPGVGWITIDVFLAETADVRRFSSQKKLTSYAGLAPGHRESAGKRHDLGIEHKGSPLLRWVVGQASWQLVRRDPDWQRIFEQIAKRRGKKKAIVAITRRLLCLMMSIVMNERPYQRAGQKAA